MQNPELFEHLLGKFYRSMYTLRDSSLAGIGDRANSVIDRVSNGDIRIVVKSDRLNSLLPTNFILHELKNTPTPTFIGAIALNIDNFLSSSSEELLADLVGPLFIAHSFPLNGYEKRLRNVYSQALEAQSVWLDYKKTPPLPLDPRTSDWEELTKRLLGKVNYYTDTGFEDWQEASLSLLDLNNNMMKRMKLVYLSNNPSHFVAARQRYSPMLYSQAPYYMETTYDQVSINQRAELAAISLLAILI